jgi:multicomponent Na+:H+ antiporter subunit G
LDVTGLVIALLTILVLGAWLGCFGYARLRHALDRLHCVTFVNAGCGLALLLTSLAADGLSTRTFKVAVIACAALLAGAALSHATGRALLVRAESRE